MGGEVVPRVEHIVPMEFEQATVKFIRDPDRVVRLIYASCGMSVFRGVVIC